MACGLAGCIASKENTRSDSTAKPVAKAKDETKKTELAPITKELINEDNALQQANALQAEMNRDEKKFDMTSANAKK
jgi:hypothetical protein